MFLSPYLQGRLMSEKLEDDDDGPQGLSSGWELTSKLGTDFLDFSMFFLSQICQKFSDSYFTDSFSYRKFEFYATWFCTYWVIR